MTAPLTGYTSSLPSDVLLDSGVLYVGPAGSSVVFGAFAGGLKFDPGVTYRAADFDGKRSPVKGLDRVTMRMPKITGTVIQLSTTNVGQIEPGAATAVTGAWTASTSYAPKSAGQLLASGDYLSDVRAICNAAGQRLRLGAMCRSASRRPSAPSTTSPGRTGRRLPSPSRLRRGLTPHFPASRTSVRRRSVSNTSPLSDKD